MNNSQHISHSIESILFAAADAYSTGTLATLLEVSIEEIEGALMVLQQSLNDHALMLVRYGDQVTLATRPEHTILLERVRKEALQKELSKASAETLAVVVYKPGTTKAEIELIRGVNASYSLRALQMRGLIETKHIGRTISYYPTLALLQSYGVSSIEQLPQYEETKQKLSVLLSQSDE